MNMMFAQSTDLTAAPAEILKWVLIILVTVLLIGLAVYATWKSSRKESIRIDDDPPVRYEKSAKRYNHELCTSQHKDIERRVTELENWRTALVNKMDRDKYEILAAGDERSRKIHNRINRLLASQYLIAGQMGVVIDDRHLAGKMREIEADENL